MDTVNSFSSYIIQIQSYFFIIIIISINHIISIKNTYQL